MLKIIKSSFSKKKILKLLEFSRPKSLKLDAHYKIREVTSYTFRGEFRFEYLRPKETLQILICYGKSSKYRYPQYVERGGEQKKLGYRTGWILNSVEESFIYIASHESRHLLQYQNNMFRIREMGRTKKDRYLAEVDAEKYAMKKLREWRKLNE